MSLDPLPKCRKMRGSKCLEMHFVLEMAESTGSPCHFYYTVRYLPCSYFWTPSCFTDIENPFDAKNLQTSIIVSREK